MGPEWSQCQHGYESRLMQISNAAFEGRMTVGCGAGGEFGCPTSVIEALCVTWPNKGPVNITFSKPVAAAACAEVRMQRHDCIKRLGCSSVFMELVILHSAQHAATAGPGELCVRALL